MINIFDEKNSFEAIFPKFNGYSQSAIKSFLIFDEEEFLVYIYEYYSSRNITAHLVWT